MERVVLDSDIFSDIVEGKNEAGIARARQYQRVFGSFTTSAITLFEAHRGLSYKPNAERSAALAVLKQRLNIIPIQDEEAELGGVLHGLLKRQGTPIGEMDPIIAATALTYDLTLATANSGHYQRIIDLGYPLQLENWREM